MADVIKMLRVYFEWAVVGRVGSFSSLLSHTVIIKAAALLILTS